MSAARRISERAAVTDVDAYIHPSIVDAMRQAHLFASWRPRAVAMVTAIQLHDQKRIGIRYEVAYTSDESTLVAMDAAPI